MAVSGLPNVCDNHAVSIAKLALDMIDKADSVMMGDRPIVSNILFDIFQLKAFKFLNVSKNLTEKFSNDIFSLSRK